MNLESIFKLSLVILAIAVANYFDVEKGPMQIGFLSLLLAYLIGRYLYLRRIIKQNSQDIFVLKNNDWILATVTWAVLAVMFLNNLSGVYLITNMLLLAGIMALAAIDGATDVYLINQQGINNLKTSKRIELDTISEIRLSPSALAIHTSQNRDALLIEGSKLKSKSLSQVTEAIESSRKNRLQPRP